MHSSEYTTTFYISLDLSLTSSPLAAVNEVEVQSFTDVSSLLQIQHPYRPACQPLRGLSCV